MGLIVRIPWLGGVVMESGNLDYVSRYATVPQPQNTSVTPSGVWSLSSGSGLNQADDAAEITFTLTTGSSVVISMVGANGEKDVNNNQLNLTVVKSIELLITSPTPQSGVSLLLGPQGVSDAAQLWFGGVTTNFADIVRDRFANMDRGVGWTLSSPNTNLPLKNPSAVSVSGWIRIIGV